MGEGEDVSMTILLGFVEFLAQAATALGIPLALTAYIKAKREERREQEYNAYHALDEKYVEYLQLCIQHPKLDMYYIPVGSNEVALSPEEKIQQYALCEILISLLERAYLMYRDQSTTIARSQWEGSWNAYMRTWAKRELFRRLWAELGNQFDDDFVNHMNAIIRAEMASR
jgi:hypothetical protein